MVRTRIWTAAIAIFSLFTQIAIAGAVHSSDCRALTEWLGDAPLIYTMRGSYTRQVLPGEFFEDGKAVASRLALLLPEAGPEPLATLVTLALENAYQHGRLHEGQAGYVELGLEELTDRVNVHVINPLYSAMPSQMVARQFLPGEFVEVCGERDSTRGNLGLALPIMFDSLSLIEGASMSWIVGIDAAGVGQSGLAVKFTLTVMKRNSYSGASNTETSRALQEAVEN